MFRKTVSFYEFVALIVTITCIVSLVNLVLFFYFDKKKPIEVKTQCINGYISTFEYDGSVRQVLDKSGNSIKCNEEPNT